MKIVTVIGARPQFVKAAVVSREISKYDNIKECIIHTGQHFDKNMSTVFFEEMQIPLPDYNLNINGLSHGAMTGQMLEGIESILFKEKPDWVLVYGDTNSTLAGALAARKNHIKVAHVEAGLRSYNMDMPEEINRILTDRISDVLFCPTDTAIKNLWKEGFKNLDCEILKSGDVMKDAMSFYMNKASKPEYEIPEHFILCTVHRAENTDNEERMTSIIEALEVISSKYSPVVVPLHPRTEKKLLKRNYDFKTSKIHFIKPVECFGIVGMAAVSMKDGLVKLLKGDSLTRGIKVDIDSDNRIEIDFHVIVSYGVCISTVADNLIENVKYKVSECTGLEIKKINIYVEGVRVID